MSDLTQIGRVLLAASLCSACCGQDANANALVRRAIDHQREAERTRVPMRYRLHKLEDGRETVKEIVESREGDVAKLVEVDGKPLTPAQELGERTRLATLAAHPELEEKRHRREAGDAKRIADLLALLPDGLVYQSAGEAPCGGGQCWRLNFSPKPGWTPPNLEADVLRAVAGTLLIDKSQERLVRIDARFISDASFGLGFLARIDKGGTATLEQMDVGHGTWELTNLLVNLKGKALLVKTIAVRLTEATSGYEPVPSELGYRDAIHMLEK